MFFKIKIYGQKSQFLWLFLIFHLPGYVHLWADRNELPLNGSHWALIIKHKCFGSAANDRFLTCSVSLTFISGDESNADVNILFVEFGLEQCSQFTIKFSDLKYCCKDASRSVWYLFRENIWSRLSMCKFSTRSSLRSLHTEHCICRMVEKWVGHWNGFSFREHLKFENPGFATEFTHSVWTMCSNAVQSSPQSCCRWAQSAPFDMTPIRLHAPSNWYPRSHFWFIFCKTFRTVFRTICLSGSVA